MEEKEKQTPWRQSKQHKSWDTNNSETYSDRKGFDNENYPNYNETYNRSCNNERENFCDQTGDYNRGFNNQRGNYSGKGVRSTTNQYNPYINEERTNGQPIINHKSQGQPRGGQKRLSDQNRNNRPICDFCSKFGHLAQDCFQRLREERRERTENLPIQTSPTNTRVTFDTNIGHLQYMQKENKVEKQLLRTIERESPSEVFLKSKFITVPIHKMCNGEIYSTKVTFGRIEIEARLDSGSDTSVVSQSLVKTIPLLQNATVHDSNLILQVADGNQMKVLGVLEVNMKVSKLEFHTHLAILEDLSTPLILGNDFLNKYQAVLNFSKTPSLRLSLPKNLAPKSSRNNPTGQDRWDRLDDENFYNHESTRCDDEDNCDNRLNILQKVRNDSEEDRNRQNTSNRKVQKKSHHESTPVSNLTQYDAEINRCYRLNSMHIARNDSKEDNQETNNSIKKLPMRLYCEDTLESSLNHSDDEPDYCNYCNDKQKFSSGKEGQTLKIVEHNENEHKLLNNNISSEKAKDRISTILGEVEPERIKIRKLRKTGRKRVIQKRKSEAKLLTARKQVKNIRKLKIENRELRNEIKSTREKNVQMKKKLLFLDKITTNDNEKSTLIHNDNGFKESQSTLELIAWNKHQVHRRVVHSTGNLNNIAVMQDFNGKQEPMVQLPKGEINNHALIPTDKQEHNLQRKI